MNRRNKTIEYRNRQIYEEYITHLRNGLPVMEAYAACGNSYDLSEESIRKIVAKQARGALKEHSRTAVLTVRTAQRLEQPKAIRTVNKR